MYIHNWNHFGCTAEINTTCKYLIKIIAFKKRGAKKQVAITKKKQSNRYREQTSGTVEKGKEGGAV